MSKRTLVIIAAAAAISLGLVGIAYVAGTSHGKREQANTDAAMIANANQSDAQSVAYSMSNAIIIMVAMAGLVGIMAVWMLAMAFASIKEAKVSFYFRTATRPTERASYVKLLQDHENFAREVDSRNERPIRLTEE